MNNVDDSALAFQDPLDRIVAVRAPIGLRLWPILAGLMLAVFVGLAGVARLDVVVVATGRLAAASPPILMKPLSAGILREMHVSPGDTVVAGQSLARLDATFSAADLASVEAKYRSLSASVARIEAELAGRALAVGTPELALQAEVMAQRDAVAAAERSAHASRVAAAEAAFAEENHRVGGIEARLSLYRQVEDMRRRLADRAAGTPLAVIEAEAARIAVEAEVAGSQARLDQLRQSLNSARTEEQGLLLNRRRLLLEELAATQPQLAIVAEDLAKARALSAGAEIRAPRPGVILETAAGGEGSLIAAGEAVVTFVPTDVPLIAEVSLRSVDSGRVAAGDQVTIKVDAYPWRRHGTLSGTLDEIGQSSRTPEGSVIALHAARVRLDRDLALPGPDGPVRLLPGMTLTAEVHGGTRTILDYFFDPLIRGLDESLREP